MKFSTGPRHFAIVEVETAERRLLISLFADVAALLTADAPESDSQSDELEKLVGLASGERPQDPAVQRLLPDLTADDPDRAAEFRRLTEVDLREGKLSNLRTALHTLAGTGRIELSEEQARAWVVALTDVRLVIATRLGIASDDDFEELDSAVDLDEHTSAMLVVYDFLTWGQEQLSELMLRALSTEEPRDSTDLNGEDL